MYLHGGKRRVALGQPGKEILKNIKIFKKGNSKTNVFPPPPDVELLRHLDISVFFSLPSPLLPPAEAAAALQAELGAL